VIRGLEAKTPLPTKDTKIAPSNDEEKGDFPTFFLTAIP
jgi:hypothetical protein